MKAKNKKVLSAAIASALVVAQMVMPVAAADGGEIDVTVTTKNPVIRVTVPTDLQIAVDQFEMTDKGTQITSGIFTMDNKSEVPVKVDVTSTFTLDSEITLAATKKGAQETETSQAWLAVAAQTKSNSYDDPATDDGDADAGKENTLIEEIGDMTEASFNVVTVAANEGGANVATQTFYLGAPTINQTTTKTYTLLVPSANKSNEGVSYAQFYELTKIGPQPTTDATLKAEVDKDDVYVIPNTATPANGDTVTKISKGSTVADGTYNNSNDYYTAATTATVKDNLTANTNYIYAEVDATDGGKAAFRYIGQLAESKLTWTNADIQTVNVKYDIYGVTATKYEEVENSCVYGLYVEGAGDDKEDVETLTGTLLSNTAGTSTFNTAATVATRIKGAGTTVYQFSADTKTKLAGLEVKKIVVDDAEYSFTVGMNSTAATVAVSDGKTYVLSGFDASTASKIQLYYGDTDGVKYIVEYTFN